MDKQMTTTLTRGEALDTVNFAIEQFINDLHIKSGEIETITYAVNNDLQIRDYFLGLPTDFDIATCIDFVGYLASRTNDSECYAYNTIYAMYEIEQGNTELAKSLLEISEQFNAEYNLTKLAKRIISAGWNGSMLKEMREDLHPKVVATIQDEPNYEIGELA